MRIEGSHILYFDPFSIDEESHDADIIFITHDHFDHFQPESIKKIINEKTQIVLPQSMEKVSKKLKLDNNIVFMNVRQIKEIRHLEVETIAAYNKRKPFHPKKAGFVGYIVTMDNIRYYVAGDTDFTDELKDVRCDIAMVPIGGMYTMDAKEAAKLVNKIGPKIAVPVHYGEVAGKMEDADVFEENCSKSIEVARKIQ